MFQVRHQSLGRGNRHGPLHPWGFCKTRGQCIENVLLGFLPESRQGPDPACLRRCLQFGQATDLQLVRKPLHPLGPEPGNAEQPRESRRDPFALSLYGGRGSCCENFFDLSRQIVADPRKAGQIFALRHHLRHLGRKIAKRSGSETIGPDPEGIGAFDLQQVSHFLESCRDLGVMHCHERSAALSGLPAPMPPLTCDLLLPAIAITNDYQAMGGPPTVGI